MFLWGVAGVYSRVDGEGYFISLFLEGRGSVCGVCHI